MLDGDSACLLSSSFVDNGYGSIPLLSAKKLGIWCNGCTFEFGSKGGVSTTSFPTKKRFIFFNS